MRESQYGEEAGVDDDLTEVVRTAHQLKQTSFRYGVARRVLPLQLGESLMSLELLVPSSQEDGRGEPGRQRHAGEGELGRRRRGGVR